MTVCSQNIGTDGWVGEAVWKAYFLKILAAGMRGLRSARLSKARVPVRTERPELQQYADALP